MAIWNPIGMLLSVAALNTGGTSSEANVAYICTKFEDALNYLTGEVK